VQFAWSEYNYISECFEVYHSTGASEQLTTEFHLTFSKPRVIPHHHNRSTIQSLQSHHWAKIVPAHLENSLEVKNVSYWLLVWQSKSPYHIHGSEGLVAIATQIVYWQSYFFSLLWNCLLIALKTTMFNKLCLFLTVPLVLLLPFVHRTLPN
jgi:hypothetical protein